MQKDYMSLGLMSGTSGDGVDASLIRSDGITNYEVLKDRYFEYDKDIFEDIHKLKEKILKKELERNLKAVEEDSTRMKIHVILCLLSLLLLLTLEEQLQKLRKLINHTQEKYKY